MPPTQKSSPKVRITKQVTAKHSSIREKYPDKVPVICKPIGNNIVLLKKKYLVPENMKFGEFIYLLRRSIVMTETQALYAFVSNSTLIPTHLMMKELYDSHYDKEDKMLYITLTVENTFGCV